MLTTKSIHEYLSNHAGITPAQSRKVTDALTTLIIEETSRGNPLRIVHLGTFSPVHHSERTLNNSLVSNCVVPAHTTLKFKASSDAVRELRSAQD